VVISVKLLGVQLRVRQLGLAIRCRLLRYDAEAAHQNHLGTLGRRAFMYLLQEAMAVKRKATGK